MDLNGKHPNLDGMIVNKKNLKFYEEPKVEN